MTDKNENAIKILIVDASVTARDFFKEALADAPDIEVVAVAPSGTIGLQKIDQFHPDLVLFDMNINDVSSSEFTIESLKRYKNMGVILTTVTSIGTEIVGKILFTLENGAFDFIEKPDDSAEEEMAVATLKRKLLPKIWAFSIKRYSRIAIKASGSGAIKKETGTGDKSVKRKDIRLKPSGSQHLSIIVIGVSTGGPEALTRIIPLLPRSFHLPIVIVLHMPKLFTKSMAAELNKKSQLDVKESAPGDVLKPGIVFLAQGGIHLVVKKNSEGRYSLDFDDGPPENGCKPSVDVLFRSISENYKDDVLALILTGMGLDGVQGMGLLKEKGVRTIAQDEESSLIWGMPGAAVKAGFIDEVLPIDSIALRIMEITGAG